MKRDDYTDNGVYSEIFDQTPLLMAATQYMKAEYGATGDGRWNGPGPGIYFAQFKSADGRHFKVKAFYFTGSDDVEVGSTTTLTEEPEYRVEVVEVLERAIINRKSGRRG